MIALKKIMQLEKNINERCIENISIRKELLMESREIMLGVNNVFYKVIILQLPAISYRSKRHIKGTA